MKIEGETRPRGERFAKSSFPKCRRFFFVRTHLGGLGMMDFWIRFGWNSEIAEVILSNAKRLSKGLLVLFKEMR